MFFRKKDGGDEKRGRGASRKVERGPPERPKSTQFLTGDALRDRRSVEALLDEIARVAERVAREKGPADLRELLTYIVDASVERTGAERGLLVLAGPGKRGERDALEVMVARQRRRKWIEGEVRYSTSAVKRVLENGAARKDRFSSAAEGAGLGQSVRELGLRSLMCVPLDAVGELRAGYQGVLYVDSTASAREFSQQDLTFFSALSTQSATALRTARLHVDSLERARLEEALETARIVQKNLMPEIPADCAGFDLFAWYQAAERTSGDFYDYFVTPGGRHAVVVGDVTGHGPASALITSTAQAFLRSSLLFSDDPERALTMLNRDLAKRMEPGHFVTLFLALLEPRGAAQIFDAGHAPPLVWRRAGGSIESLAGGHGPALGMIGDFEYRESISIELAEGDLLLAYTDGLSEARSKEAPDQLLREDGLRRVLQTVAPSATTAHAVGESIVEAVHAHARGNHEDDLTLVVVRRSRA